MTFGTIAASATPAADLYTELETLLTAHAGWEFVETWVGGTDDYHVWRNLGTQNTWQQDFHVAMSPRGTSLEFFAFEEWDAVNKKAINPCYSPAQQNVTFEADASVGGSAGFDLNSNAAFYETFELIGNEVDFTWWLWVDVNSIRGMTTNDTYGLYVGLFDPFWPDHPSEFPLTIMMLNKHVSAYFRPGCVSRRPGAEGIAYSGSTYDKPMSVDTQSTTYYGVVEGTIPTVTHGLYNNGVLGAPFLVKMTHVSMGSGTYRGLLKHVMKFENHADVEKGDTISMDGATYTYMGAGGLWFGEAA